MAAAPPRRLPRRVYWVRRFVVLGVPMVVVALLVAAWTGRGDDPSSTAKPKSSTSTPQATSKASDGKKSDGTKSDDADATTDGAGEDAQPASVGGVPVCSVDDLEVSMVSKHEKYDSTAKPTFVVTIRSHADEPCLLDAGAQNWRIVITSGTDHIWSSQDCAAEDAESRPLLLADGEKTTEKVTWSRTRSKEGCPSGLPAPRSGTYAATLTVRGVDAAPAVFHLG